MLRFLLDTNICIYLMKEQPEPVIRRFSACKPGEVGVSSITWAELCCGLEVHNSPPELTALSNSLVIKDFDVQAAAFFGNLFLENSPGSFQPEKTASMRSSPVPTSSTRVVPTTGPHKGGAKTSSGMVAAGCVSGAPVGDNDDISALAGLAAVECDPAC